MSLRVDRICFISDAPHFGGAERYLLDMCAAAHRRSIHAHIHCFGPPLDHESPTHSQTPAWLPGEAARQHVSSSRQSGYGFGKLFDMLRREKPDAAIINASGRPGMWRSTWACSLFGILSAWVHHMVDPIDPRRLRPRHLNGYMEGLSLWRVPQSLRHRLAAAGARAVISSNPKDADYLRRWGFAPAHKIHVVPPGIDPDRCKSGAQDRLALRRRWLVGLPDDSWVLGTATRLVDGKGIETLIDATAQLARDNPHVALLIAGTGPRREWLEQQARDRGLDGRVRFVGFVENMSEFYCALDAFALCSTSESFGLTIAEAMACGCATIATPTHGAERQIQHFHNGLMTEGFTVESIVACVRALRDHDALRDRLAAQAQETALAAFTIDRTLDATLAAITRPSNRLGTAAPLSSPAVAVSAPEAFA